MNKNRPYYSTHIPYSLAKTERNETKRNGLGPLIDTAINEFLMKMFVAVILLGESESFCSDDIGQDVLSTWIVFVPSQISIWFDSCVFFMRRGDGERRTETERKRKTKKKPKMKEYYINKPNILSALSNKQDMNGAQIIQLCLH